MLVSTDAEKSFDKIQESHENSQKLGIDGEFSQLDTEFLQQATEC